MTSLSVGISKYSTAAAASLSRGIHEFSTAVAAVEEPISPGVKLNYTQLFINGQLLMPHQVNFPSFSLMDMVYMNYLFLQPQFLSFRLS